MCGSVPFTHPPVPAPALGCLVTRRSFRAGLAAGRAVTPRLLFLFRSALATFYFYLFYHILK